MDRAGWDKYAPSKFTVFSYPKQPAGLPGPVPRYTWREGGGAYGNQTGQTTDRHPAGPVRGGCGGALRGGRAAAGKVPPLEPYRPWLEEHKVQAIAITAAILFGLSLLLFPPEEGGAEPAAPEEGPCAGYERTEDLP